MRVEARSIAALAFRVKRRWGDRGVTGPGGDQGLDGSPDPGTDITARGLERHDLDHNLHVDHERRLRPEARIDVHCSAATRGRARVRAIG